MSKRLYRDKQTGKIYRHLAYAVDRTEPDATMLMRVYCADDDEHDIDVCVDDVFKSRMQFLLDDELRNSQ